MPDDEKTGGTAASRWKSAVQFMRSPLRNRQNARIMVGNFLWMVLDKILRMILGLSVGIWLTRYLGPEEFGLYNYANAVVALFGVIAALGLNAVVVRDLVGSAADKHEIIGTATLLRLGAGMGALVLVGLTVVWVRPETRLVQWLIIIGAAAFLFQALDTIDLWFQAQQTSKYSLYTKTAAYVMVSFAKIGLILAHAPLIAFVWAGLVEAGLAALALIVVYQASGEKIQAWRVSLRRMAELLRTCWPLFLSGLSGILFAKLDVLLLADMRDAKEVGIYAAATRLSELWYFIPMTVVAAVQPRLMSLKLLDERIYHARLRSLYSAMSGLGLAIAILTTIFANLIIHTAYGNAYDESVSVLIIHIWAGVAVFLGVASSPYLIIEGLQKIYMYKNLVGLVSNVLLNLLLIPPYGAKGAAMATVVSYFTPTLALFLFPQTKNQARCLLFAMNPFAVFSRHAPAH